MFVGCVERGLDFVSRVVAAAFAQEAQYQEPRSRGTQASGV
jgi:hypothetical protein